MRLKESFIIYFILILLNVSISEASPRPIFSTQTNMAVSAPLKIKDMNCDQLLENYQNKSNVLYQLAGIRAHKKCMQSGKKFIFDVKTLNETDVKFFLNEFNQANIDITEVTSATTTTKETDKTPSLNVLKLKLKLAGSPNEKLNALKDIRDYYKNKKNPQQLLSSQLQIFNFSLDVLKYNQINSEAEKTKKFKKNQLYTDNLKPFADSALEAGIVYARNQWRNQEDDKALDVLNQINTQVFDKTNLVDIYYLSALIYEDKEQYAEAALFYEKTLDAITKTNILKSQLLVTPDKVNWRKAWLFYKNKQWVDAEYSFSKIVAVTSDMSEKLRARFFQARCLKKLGKTSQAEDLFKLNTQDDFFSFYSLISYRELNQKISPFKNIKYTGTLNFEEGFGKVLNTNAQSIFTELLANEEFDIVENAIPRLTSKLDEQIFLNLKLAEKSEKYYSLFVNFARLEQKQKQDVLARFPQLIFPRPYEDQVKEMARITELPTSLIYSIMKQESGFNPKIKSHANALGLMQVIPALAKSLAKKYKVPYKKPDDLLKPEINIQLGSYELSDQVKKQNNQYTFVTAAYNAGPAALAKWLKTKYKPQFDTIDFIEEIPYDETKVYAKVIARNFIFYSLIENPTSPLTFPENFVLPFDVLSQK